MKVSIITPTSETILDRTIDSIRNQTNKNFEWIVVTDGILPSTLPILIDPVKIVSLWGGNYGASVARNVGFQISDGEIITYLDADDKLDPNRVAHLLEIWEKYPTTEILFSGYHIEQGGFRVFFNHMDNFGGRTDASRYINVLQTQNICIPLGVAHTRKPFVNAGGFQRGIVCGEDGILWRRMVNLTFPDRVMFDDSSAGTYYVNDNGQSRKQPRPRRGGFAFDGSKKDNGQYLDESWYQTYNSVNLFDKE